jgi:phosphatidate cytidylyltransferase
MSRLLTGLGLVAVAYYLVFWAPQLVFLAATVLMSVLCFREFHDLIGRHGIERPGLFSLAGGLSLLFLPTAYAFLITALIMVAAFVAALRFAELRDLGPYVAGVLLGMFYTVAPWRFAIELRALSVHILFFALALNWAGDSIAYYVGRQFGKHKLAPIASPNKSWEGAIAAVLGAVIFGVLYLGYFVPHLPKWQVLIMAVVGNVAGQFGDLAESAMKRGAGVKDSGNILPGHGGMLDRVDSTLFSLPVVYSLLLAFHQIGRI